MESSPLSDPPSSYPPPTALPPTVPPPRQCSHCKQLKPDEDFVGVKDPSKRTLRCLACRGQQQRFQNRSRDAIRSLAEAQKRDSSNIQSPEKQRQSQHRPITPVVPSAAEPVQPEHQSPVRRRLGQLGRAARGAARTVSRIFRRGINSQDSPRMKHAHAEQTRIRRENRLARRDGLEPPPTPGTQQLLPSLSSPSATTADDDDQSSILGSDGFQSPPLLSPALPVGRQSQLSSRLFPTPSVHLTNPIRSSSPPRPSSAPPQSSAPHWPSQLSEPVEPVQPPFTGDLSAIAVSETDRQLIAQWQSEMSSLTMERCSRCNRRQCWIATL